MKVHPIPFRERLACSVRDLTQALGLGRSTIYENLRNGTLVSIKKRRRRLIDMRSVLQLLDPNMPSQEPEEVGDGPPPQRATDQLDGRKGASPMGRREGKDAQPPRTGKRRPPRKR